MFSVGRKIICIIFLVIYLSTRSESVPNISEFYLNPSVTKILSYQLEYTPNFQARTFRLRCLWTVYNSESVNDYQFYNKYLDVRRNETYLTKADSNNMYKRQVNSIEYTNEFFNPNATDIDTYSYEGQHSPGLYNLDFKRVYGYLENNLKGFYFDQYYDEKGAGIPYLITQFAPVGARLAFPSLDEPKYRATFKITINRPTLYNCVISNAPWKTSILKDDLISDSFEATEKISPSSVTILVSTFQVSRKFKNSIHRFVGRPELIKSNQYEYVGKLIMNIYQEIQNFLRVSCEQKYLFHVAIPSNRMKYESLGTYRNVNHYKEDILIITNQTSAHLEEKATITIAKLIAQQWFLSYLMVDRWKSVWISQGLTMYLSYNITAQLYPAWIIEERLMCKTRIAMQKDSRCCCTALNEEAQKRLDIEAKFNIITVYKGTALITMLERILPPKVFTEGLTNLIKHHKWSTYSSNDLYKEFEDLSKLNKDAESLKSPKNLSAIMSPWENNMGYPVLTVTRNYGTDKIDYVYLSQKRFHRDDMKSNTIWSIPINYSTKFLPNFNNTKPLTWLKSPNRKIKIISLRKTDWLILNNQATYYYRVQYDDNNWNAIAEALHQNFKTIHYLNRMQIIDDAFSLAEFGMLKYSIAFKIGRYVKNETEYAPLKVLKEACESINKKIVGSVAYMSFQNFLRVNVEYIYEAIKNDLIKDDTPPPNPSMHRQMLTLQMLFYWLCELKWKNCDSIRMYKLDDKLHETFWKDLEKDAVCGTVNTGNSSYWNILFDNYKKSFKSRSSSRNTFKELGCSPDSLLQEKFLIYIMKSQKDNIIEAIKLIIKQEHSGVNLVINYIPKLFKYLLNIYSNRDIEDILNDIGSRVTTKKQLDHLITFSEEHSTCNNLIKPSLSIARKNLEWRKKHLKRFENYFQNMKSIGTKHYSNVLVFVLIIPYYAN